MDDNARALVAIITELGLAEVSRRYFKDAGLTGALSHGGFNATPWEFKQIAGAIYFAQVDRDLSDVTSILVPTAGVRPPPVTNGLPRVLVLNIATSEIDGWYETFAQFEVGVHHTVITPQGKILWQSPAI